MLLQLGYRILIRNPHSSIFFRNIYFIIRTLIQTNLLIYPRDMPYVILHNFCNSCQTISYPLSGLRALVAIVTKSVDEEDTDVDNIKLRMILLVHISKLRIKVIDSSAFIGNFESMNQVNEDPETALWLDVARKTLINADVSYKNFYCQEKLD